MANQPHIEPEELQARIIYAMCLPGVRMAARFGVPLAQMKKLLEMAYYHETRRIGLSMKDAMATMKVSIAKAALLSRQLKENFSPADPDAEHALPRRIEYALWAEPLTAGKLAVHFKDAEREAIDAALERLVREGRVAMESEGGGVPSYRLVTSHARRMWNTWLARVDGLNNALGSLSDAVFSRFFAADEPAFARTVSFHLATDREEELRKLYEEQVFPLILALDEDANSRADADVRTMSLTLLWAPNDVSKAPSPATEPEENR